jgi:hypothetical protein
MTKIILQDIATLTNEQSAIDLINQNSAIIESVADTFLSRDGTSPNQMVSSLDMNSNRIINLPSGLSATEPLRVQDLANFIGGGSITVPNITTSGVLHNTRLAKTGTYSVVNADKGFTLALGGSAFYTLTFNVASGYDSNFQVIVVNEDTVRGKTLAINGLSNFILYPGQSVIVFNQNNSWKVLGKSRYKVTGGTFNMFTDFTNGNDVNDGLASGAGNAKKTVQGALDALANDFDFTGYSGISGEPSGPTLVVINMAASTTDTAGVHFTGQGIVGAVGGAAIKIQGASGSIMSTTSADAMFFAGPCIVQLAGIKLQTTTSGSSLNVDLGAQVYLLTGMDFGACAGSHIAVNNGAKVYILNNYTVSGNATTAHNLAQNPGSLITGAGITVTVSTNVTTAFWALITNLAGLVETTFTFSLGAFSVTAKRYEADNLGLISTNGGGANYFPGNVAGTTSGGGQYI